MERKRSMCLRVRQISTSPAVAPLSDVLKVVQSLYQLTNSIEKQHSPHLRPFVEGEINVEIGLNQITGLIGFFHRKRFFHRKHVITDGFRAGIQVVPGRQHNGQHLV